MVIVGEACDSLRRHAEHRWMQRNLRDLIALRSERHDVSGKGFPDTTQQLKIGPVASDREAAEAAGRAFLGINA
jgi:hypothetical protein